jgi:hypothetical protein
MTTEHTEVTDRERCHRPAGWWGRDVAGFRSWSPFLVRGVAARFVCLLALEIPSGKRRESATVRALIDELRQRPGVRCPPERRAIRLCHPFLDVGATAGHPLCRRLRRFQCHPLHMGLHRPLDALGAFLRSELALRSTSRSNFA